MPQRLVQRFEEALADPDLLALRQQLAVVDALLTDAVAHIDDGDPHAQLTEARRVFRRLQRASRAGNVAAMRAELVALGDVIEQGDDSDAGVDRVRVLIRDRAALVAAESARLVQMRQMLTVEQMLALSGALLAAVKLHVPPETARDVANAFEQLLGRRVELDGHFDA